MMLAWRSWEITAAWIWLLWKSHQAFVLMVSIKKETVIIKVEEGRNRRCGFQQRYNYFKSLGF